MRLFPLRLLPVCAAGAVAALVVGGAIWVAFPDRATHHNIGTPVASKGKLPRPNSLAALLPLRLLPPAMEERLTYCDPGGKALGMDFYRPKVSVAVPVVLQVHGGSWILYSRTAGITAPLVSGFLKKGLAFATIDYQLGNGRAAIEDVACAVRYLRASAAHLGIDGRIGALGESAGGQLVSLLATTDPAAGFDVGQYLKESSRVNAVVDEWGPVIFDATLLKRIPYVPTVFRTSSLSALKQYSPLSYLTKDDPPFLIVNGAEDSTVPPYQSTNFAAALKAAGVPERLLIVQHAGHSLAPAGGTPTPTATQVESDVVSFFATRLRGR